MTATAKLVNTHPRTQHRILLTAKGVPAAIKAVEAALAAQESRATEKAAAHQKWRSDAVKRALEPGFDPGAEPNPRVSWEERQALAAGVAKARTALELVVAAQGAEIADQVRVREAEVLADARAAVATLDAVVVELGQLGRAASTVALVLDLPGFGAQSRPSFDELVKLVRHMGDDLGAVLNIPPVELPAGRR